MDLRLADRVVVVTGGARGIGAATVRAFVGEGARVFCVDRDRTAGESLLTAIDRPGQLRFLEADLEEVAACEGVVASVIAHWGRLDVLVNNAGRNDGLGLDAMPGEFLAGLQRNLLHVYALTHYAAPHLRAAGGTVINLGSKVAVTGQGQTSAYAAAKGAIHALTREWALAFAADGVRVNCVVPAECLTDQYQRWFDSQPQPEAARAAVARLVPFGRRLTAPEEVADAIVFLASSKAGHITGQLQFVDGGYTHLDRAASHDHRKWS